MKGIIKYIDNTWVIEYWQHISQVNTTVQRLTICRQSLDKIAIIYPNMVVDFDEILVSPIGRELDIQSVNQNKSQAKKEAKIRLDKNNSPINLDWEEEINKCKNSFYYFYTRYVTIEGKPATTHLSEKEFNAYILGNFNKAKNKNKTPRK